MQVHHGPWWVLSLLLLLLLLLPSPHILPAHPPTEFLLVFPTLSIGLETHHHHPLFPLYTIQHFIPLLALEDVVIQEGLHGWDMRYCLAVLVWTRLCAWCSSLDLGIATQH